MKLYCIMQIVRKLIWNFLCFRNYWRWFTQIISVRNTTNQIKTTNIHNQKNCGGFKEKSTSLCKIFSEKHLAWNCTRLRKQLENASETFSILGFEVMILTIDQYGIQSIKKKKLLDVEDVEFLKWRGTLRVI